VPSRLLYILLLCVLVTSVPALADIVFTDSTFDAANYNNFSAIPTLDSDVTATYGQCSSCGNPGQALQAVVSIPSFGGAYVGFLNNTFVYNPQTEGAILSLSAWVDKNLTLDRSTTDFASSFYPLIEQGGNFYVASIAGGTINSGTTTGYETITSQTLSPAGLTATDFGLYDFTAALPDFSSNPDFSATGASMIFGLAPLVYANAPYTMTVNYDNLNFDITPDTQGGITQSAVPESSSLGLLSIFLMGLLLRGLGPAVRWKLKRQ
jgi:hypothetical protein